MKTPHNTFSRNYIIITNYDSTYGFNVNINGKELSDKKCQQWERKYWNHNDYRHETESYFKYLRHYYGKKYNLIIYIENESICIVQDTERGIYEQD